MENKKTERRERPEGKGRRAHTPDPVPDTDIGSRLQALGLLAGGLAHDLNNILATISGYAELLRDDLKEDPVLTGRAEKILAAVGRARSLTDNILNLRDNKDASGLPVNISEIVKETIGHIRIVTPVNVTIAERLHRGTLKVKADPASLFSVVYNLVLNAVQAIGERQGTITVSTGVEQAGLLKSKGKLGGITEFASLTVEDSGPGIEEKIRERIFDPFFTTKGEQGGRGLGLSVVREAVTRMNGEIEVSTRLGRGSAFKVLLPLFL